jgi:hypothetical protein
MKYRLAGMLMVIFLASCNNNNSSTNTEEESTITKAAIVTEKDIKSGRFDLLENLFQNENWLVINNNDSSYLYCSRIGRAYFKTYHYKIIKGDSVNTVVTEIKLSADTITWQLPQQSTPVYLNHITSSEAVWADKGNLNFYNFHRVDSNHLYIKYPDGSFKNLAKTITLSAFLVRSKYDYLHGTGLAFDNKK